MVCDSIRRRVIISKWQSSFKFQVPTSLCANGWGGTCLFSFRASIIVRERHSLRGRPFPLSSNFFTDPPLPFYSKQAKPIYRVFSSRRGVLCHSPYRHSNDLGPSARRESVSVKKHSPGGEHFVLSPTCYCYLSMPLYTANPLPPPIESYLFGSKC